MTGVESTVDGFSSQNDGDLQMMMFSFTLIFCLKAISSSQKFSNKLDDWMLAKAPRPNLVDCEFNGLPKKKGRVLEKFADVW